MKAISLHISQETRDFHKNEPHLSIVEEVPTQGRDPLALVESVFIPVDDLTDAGQSFSLHKTKSLKPYEILSLESKVNKDLNGDNNVGDSLKDVISSHGDIGTLYYMESSALYFSEFPTDDPIQDGLLLLDGDGLFNIPINHSFISGFENDLGEVEIIISESENSSMLAKFYLSDEVEAYVLETMISISHSALSYKEFLNGYDLNGNSEIEYPEFVSADSNLKNIKGSNNFEFFEVNEFNGTISGGEGPDIFYFYDEFSSVVIDDYRPTEDLFIFEGLEPGSYIEGKNFKSMKAMTRAAEKFQNKFDFDDLLYTASVNGEIKMLRYSGEGELMNVISLPGVKDPSEIQVDFWPYV